MQLINKISFPVKGDSRGSLIAIEQFREVPFEIKRIYYIFDTKSGVSRGFHAHKNLEQVIICVKGSCVIHTDNGCKRERIQLENPRDGLHIRGMVWREMHDFSHDCVLVVLASQYYEEDDYIRSYEQFISEVRNVSKDS